MPKPKLSLSDISSADEIEAAFYEALQSGDIDKLMACWADEDDIVCVHPGGPRLIGASQIRSSFEAMFANGTIQARPERTHRLQALGACMHNLVERLDILTPEGPAQAFVVATNVYHQTPQGWRMVVHHASPGSAADGQAIDAPSMVLH
ncbi:MAG: nuclear transport factor 2 family protein [Betaproteobacteria bacterium]